METVKKVKNNRSGISLGVFIAVCALFFWQLRDIKSDMRAFTIEIRNDMKDFHKEMSKFNGRLYTLEEKYQQIDRRK